MKFFKDSIEKHRLLFCYIIAGVVSITGIGLILILPLILAIKFSIWFLLLYLLIIGIGIGIETYLDV